MVRQKKKKNCWFPVTQPTLILTPDTTTFFHFSPRKKNASTGKRSSYPSTMMVTNIFHDRHLPVDKTSIVTARGLAVVSQPAVSKKKKNKIFFWAMLSETNSLFFFFFA
jgi:hypothetical protein